MWFGFAELVTDVISLRADLPPAPAGLRTLPLVSRRLLRLLVPTPDRARVLARPNGLAGWTLPTLPVADCTAVTWDDELLSAASRVVGAAVRPVREVAPGAWEVEATGRVPATGATWIAPAEAGRLGADAALLVRWADSEG
jgi:hypothetical protein